jgi:hypothetical protein
MFRHVCVCVCVCGHANKTRASVSHEAPEPRRRTAPHLPLSHPISKQGRLYFFFFVRLPVPSVCFDGALATCLPAPCRRLRRGPLSFIAAALGHGLLLLPHTTITLPTTTTTTTMTTKAHANRAARPSRCVWFGSVLEGRSVLNHRRHPPTTIMLIPLHRRQNPIPSAPLVNII